MSETTGYAICNGNDEIIHSTFNKLRKESIKSFTISMGISWEEAKQRGFYWIKIKIALEILSSGKSV